MTISAVPFVRLTALAGIALVVSGFVLGVAEQQPTTRAQAVSPTTPVQVGGLVYQAPQARVLDPGNPVDREILRGVPAARRPLPRTEAWFGVFLGVSNPQRRALPAAQRFVLVDLDGHRFAPEPLGDDAYAYRAAAVAAGRDYPPETSPAARNLTAQGALLLFRIPRASYDFGALELRIADPSGRGPAASLAVS